MSDNDNNNANNYILDVCSDNLDPVLQSLIQSRLVIGMERYGHGIRPMDNTTQWGTKEDSWLLMCEEEIADAIIYILAHYLRLVETSQPSEWKYQMTMHAIRQLGELHHIIGMLHPEAFEKTPE